MAQFMLGNTMGMPPGMAQLLQEKYRQSGMITAAQAAQANAAANLQNQQARVVVPESGAKIRASDAGAYLDREKGAAIRPALNLDIRKGDAWIDDVRANIVDRRNTTDANVRNSNAQSRGQEIDNAFAPIKNELALKRADVENKYLPQTLGSQIELNRSGANQQNTQSDVNRKNARDPMLTDPNAGRGDTSIRTAPGFGQQGYVAPGPQTMLQPSPSAQAPTSTLVGLAGITGSPSVWGGPAAQAVYPGGYASPGGGMVVGMGAPSPVMAPLMAADAGPSAGPMIRKAPTSSLFADAGGGSSLLDGSFLNNKLTLKRGTAKVPGKGSGDKVPAMLEPGEAVLNKHAAGMIGRDKIAAANAKGNQKRQKESLGKVAELVKALGMG